ncbi:MAG: TatD family hydrolase [Rhodospirillales bacterium]|nr:TatD family hydrolase [Rhodospirillales bacterium]
MLVDSHCHLDFPDFQDDLDGVVARARDAGVGHMLTVGTHVTRFDAVLAIAEAYDFIYCSVGIHPHEAAKEPEISSAHLVRMAARHPKIVALGESGLDFHYEYSPREAQERVFRAHIAAARETGLPLIVHTREADNETIEILREEQKTGAFPGVIHCFSSGREMAEAAIDMGMYVSLSGIVTFKAAQALRDIAKDIPLDRLLVETDAPYLAPVPKRGKTNEPAFTAYTAACVAEIMEVSFPEFAEQTTANFFRLFSKAERPL